MPTKQNDDIKNRNRVLVRGWVLPHTYLYSIVSKGIFLSFYYDLHNLQRNDAAHTMSRTQKIIIILILLIQILCEDDLSVDYIFR